jgi:hypothetical protein
MKKIFMMLCVSLLALLGHAQILLPNAPAPLRAVVNPEMMIQFNGQRMEVLATQRGVRNAAGTYTLSNADATDVLSRDKLGVAYSYARRGHVLLTGEVSAKLRTGFQASALSGLGADIRLLAPPDVYILTVSTPPAIVSLVKQLQLNPAVEWVEPFTIQGNIN